MLNIYDYQKIRDILMVLVGDIKEGDNSDWSILVPRSPDALKDLKSFLDKRNVNFYTLPEIDETGGENVVLMYGQDAEIDDTVRQMRYDPEIQDVNKILKEMRNHKDDGATRAAIDELKKLITKVSKVQYEGEKEPSHYYFYFTDMERAQELMVELGLWVEKHTSHVNRKPVEVLRLSMSNVAGWGMGIIKELNKAAQTRQQENFEQGQGAFSKILALADLKTLINKVTRLSREEEAKPENIGKLSYCFYFDAGALDKAQELLQVLGMPTVRKEDNNGRTYLLYSVNANQLSEDSLNTIYTLDQVVLNREARAGQNDDGLRRM